MRKIDMTTDCRGADVSARDRLYTHGQIIYLEDYGSRMLDAMDKELAIRNLEIVYGEIPGGDDIAFMVLPRSD